MAYIETLESESDPTLSFRPPAETGMTTASVRSVVTLDDASSATLTTSGAAPTISPVTGSQGYELRRLIGRGGMGQVWQALQVSLGRVVAVKSPMPDGQSHGDRLAAFRQEALVAAQLEHPNIVPVHDQGLDADGRPLLAMKLVQGRSWDQVLREDFVKLSHEELLAKHLPILVDVCQAVAFAHSRGIIHRDLKPAQVMVGDFGEVMLMDWGLAMYVGDTRALEPVVRHEFPTRESCSNPSGTPALMAPEQTQELPIHLSERTDVYLLGGTLYYILTGTYPHQASSARESFARASKGRIDAPQTRTRETLPEELVSICLHALRVDPADRIQSANEFLELVGDYLSGANRRREALRIAENLDRVLDSHHRDYETLGRATSDLTRALSLWPASLRLVDIQNRLLAEYVRTAMEREDLNLAEAQARQIPDPETSSALLDEVTIQLDKRRRQAAQRRLATRTVAALLAFIAIGTTLFSMQFREERDFAKGQQTRAEAAETEAKSKTVALRGARMDADGLVKYMLGDLQTSLAELERLDLLEGVASRAATYYRETPFEELDNVERAQSVAGLRELCDVMSAQGNIEGAADNAEFAESLARMASNAAPADVQLQFELMQILGLRARIAFTQGDLESASGFAASALEIGQSILRNHPNQLEVQTIMSVVLEGQGRTFRALGNLKEALQSASESADIMEDVVTADPTDLHSMRELGSRYSGLGSIQVDNGLTDEAIKSLTRARDIMKSLTELQLENDGWQVDYAQSLQAVGHMMARAGDLDGAQEQLTKSLEIFEAVVARNPTDMEILSNSAKNLHYVAQFYQRSARAADAEATYLRALEIAKLLIQRDPTNAQSVHMGVVFRFRLARIYNDSSRKPEAEVLYAQNCDALQGLLALEPASAFWRQELASNLYNLGELQGCRSDFVAARESMNRCVEIYRELQSMNPHVTTNYDMEQGTWFLLAQTSRADHNHARALEEEGKRLGPLDRLITLEPGEDAWRREKASALIAMAEDLTALERPKEALERVPQAMALQPGADVNAMKWQTLVGRAKINEGRARIAQGEQETGQALLREGRDLILDRIQKTALADTSAYGIWDLVNSSRILGEDVDPAWLDHLRDKCFIANYD